MSILTDLEKRAESRGEQLRKLPLADIQPNEKNFYGLRDVEELAENIMAVGLLQPLVVEPAPAGSERPWKLLTGGRRYAAMVSNLDKGGPAEAVCMVQAPADEAEELLQLISTNKYRKVTYWEKLQVVMALTKAVEAKKAEGVKVWHGVDLHKATVRQAVVKLSGLSRAEASKYGTIAEKLVPELQPFVEENKMPFTVAYDVCQLPDWAQRELAEKYTAHNGLCEINAMSYTLELTDVRQGVEVYAVGEVMLAVGRYMDPEATQHENAQQLAMLQPDGSVGGIKFRWTPSGVVAITGLDKDGMEALTMDSGKFCRIASGQYKDRMTSDWWQAERAEKKQREEARERRVQVERAAKSENFGKNAAENAAKEDGWQRESREKPPEGEQHPAAAGTGTANGGRDAAGAGAEETAAEPEREGVRIEREAIQKPIQEDSSAAPQNDKTPGGWVKVESSAGPWPEHECLCAVKQYYRGEYSYEVLLWRPELKEWCASTLVDGEPVPLVADVRMWYELPEAPSDG